MGITPSSTAAVALLSAYRPALVPVRYRQGLWDAPTSPRWSARFGKTETVWRRRYAPPTRCEGSVVPNRRESQLWRTCGVYSGGRAAGRQIGGAVSQFWVQVGTEQAVDTHLMLKIRGRCRVGPGGDAPPPNLAIPGPKPCAQGHIAGAGPSVAATALLTITMPQAQESIRGVQRATRTPRCLPQQQAMTARPRRWITHRKASESASPVKRAANAPGKVLVYL